MGAKNYLRGSGIQPTSPVLASSASDSFPDAPLPCTHLLPVFLNRELSIPVTVKIRAQENESDTLDLARRLEGAGAQLLTGVTSILCQMLCGFVDSAERGGKRAVIGQYTWTCFTLLVVYTLGKVPKFPHEWAPCRKFVYFSRLGRKPFSFFRHTSTVTNTCR